MDMDFLDDIYLSLQGTLVSQAAVPWVPNLFMTDGYCEQEYTRMRDAYERVCIRLGIDTDSEDDDLNIMVQAMENVQETCCKEMFRLGMEYAAFFQR